MTNDEKRLFISQAQKEMAEAIDVKVKELTRLSIGAKGMSFLALIAPDAQLDKLYGEAVRIKTVLTEEKLNGALKELGIAAVAGAERKPPVSGWEMP